MAEDAKTTTAEAPQSAPVPKKKPGLLKKIVIGVVVFFVAVFAIAYFATSGASKTGDQLISDLQATNCSAIWDQTSSNFRSVTGEDQWTSICETLAPILQGTPDKQGVSASAGTDQDTLSEVKYNIDGTDNVTYTVTLQLIKEDGSWKLNSLDSSVKQ